uniref:NHS-like protein 2 n=2 Tax=Denticeps clupeoides TaxID=299321 RepID=A0AAY4AF40_9TELE
MPFCKRTIAPKDVGRSAARSPGAILTDLADVCGFSLCALLRQLSDLSRQSVSILEELEGELVSICRRSGTLEDKVVSLQRHVSALASKPPPKTTTNLDSESKRTAHFQSSWQQHVNVFGSWSRPECVQELHQEAQLNLQSLLQDFEEQLYENRVTGQTFRHPSSQSSEDTSTSLSRSPVALNNKKPEFVFLPAHKQVCEDETVSLGIRAQDPACGSEHRLLGWNSSLAPPVAEKPRWHLGRKIPAQLVPIDVTADGKILAVDLIQGACSPEPSQPRSLEPTTDSSGQEHIPLRKTHSDLERSVHSSPKNSSGMMEHAPLMCPSPSWNGPKGSTFSPTWNDSYNYTITSSSKQPPLNSGGGGTMCPSQNSSGLSVSSGSYSSSFTSISEPTGHRMQAVSHSRAVTMGKRSETEGAVSSPGNGYGNSQQEKRSVRSNAFKFRERSLSTPTESGSFFSTDNMCVSEESASHVARDGENYALHYPSGSSEDSASADNISVATASDFLPDGRLRLRSRSISLKKPKKKPPPPVRSVSLMKNLSDAAGGVGGRREGHFRDGRPKSLFLPGEHNFDDSFQPDFLTASKLQVEEQGLDLTQGCVEVDVSSQGPDQESELGFPPHWQLNEWRSNNDPYHSLSGSSTATGTTVVECMKVRGSSESLDSPSMSRAMSLSQLSIDAEAKVSPIKPPGLMSPSSGYSSQSETPTPTIPPSISTGLMPLGCKMRPKIPERKSSLPATSPREKTARSRLSFELPVNSQLDLSSIKPKSKAGRRHSDTSTANKPGKPNPSPSTLPVVTQTDLRSIRLRSVSRSELEDSPDGSSDIIEEEQGRDLSPPATPNPKPVKPPVAIKPPLPKRPVNLMLKSPSSSPQAQESPPASPVDRPMPVGNIYMVVRKPKPKRPPQSSTNQPPAIVPQEHQPYQHPPMLPDLDLEHGIPIEEEEDLLSPNSPEREDKSRTLPSHVTVSCLGELDKKRPKVPPPVPKKPSVLLLPSPSAQANGTAERHPPPADGSCQFPDGAMPSEPEVGDVLCKEFKDNYTPDENTPKDSALELDIKPVPGGETVRKRTGNFVEKNSSVGEKK